ncbi:MAG: hypothetical protein V3S49_06335 [Thermodesulfobacteriota bacterium]
MPKEQIENWESDRKKLRERLKPLDEGPSKLENLGYIMSLLISFVVVFMYGWIVVFTFFHTEFIERMFSGGLNFISWTQMRFTVLLVLPLVIWVAYDSFKTLRIHIKKKSGELEKKGLRVEISKELDRLDNLIKNQLEEN